MSFTLDVLRHTVPTAAMPCRAHVPRELADIARQLVVDRVVDGAAADFVPHCMERLLIIDPR